MKKSGQNVTKKQPRGSDLRRGAVFWGVFLVVSGVFSGVVDAAPEVYMLAERAAAGGVGGALAGGHRYVVAPADDGFAE